jgi:tripartite-type tricarboxylate transporter receptor subunit TctC
LPKFVGEEFMSTRPAIATAVSLLFVFAGAPAQAQTNSYPERTVRLIIPFPAGGATDVIGRLITERLSGIWKQPVVIENVAGAAGALGTAQGAKAAPDGYTMTMATGTTTTLLPHLRRNLGFEPLRDFEAVSLLCSFPNILVVRPAVPANNVKELIALAQANPGKYSYASSGYGASPHLAAEWFKLMTKTDILHVPFTGSAPAIPALLGGHVDMMFDTMPSIWPQVQSGKLRALAVTTAERIPFAPDLPAIAEDLPGYDVGSWLGILVPAGTPPEIRAKIANEVQQITNDPAVVQKFKDLGAVAKGSNSIEFAAYMRREYDKWERVIRETGIKLSN